MIRQAILVLLVAVAATAAHAAASLTQKPTVQKKGAGAEVTFAVNESCDVEVSILDAQGKVVRHLAAGVVGGDAPPPAPLTPGLSQTLEWDGMDDYGQQAESGPFKVRVRLGMGVKPERIVGGDPYALYSKQMGGGDHSGWKLTGLEVKPDGKVYVLANATNIGQPVIRQYDAAGNYRRTVFPPAAGLPAEKVKGWGIVTRPDGGYSYRYSDLGSVSLSTTFISGWRAPAPYLIPSPDKDSLLLCPDVTGPVMKVNVDGTIAPDPIVRDKLIAEPSLLEETEQKRMKSLAAGQLHMTLSPDGTHYYLSALFAGEFVTWRRNRVGAAKDGFWRDGQVFKVDASTHKAEPFFALDGDKVIADLGARSKSPIADAKYGHYAALHGAVADAEGRVFVGDRQNRRILVLDKDANILREIPCDYPDRIAVNPKSKVLYVTTRMGHYHGHGKLTLLKFNDWSKDTEPSATIPLCEVSHFSQRTHLAVAESNGTAYLWVAYTALPVRIFKDKGDGLELVKDFYEAGAQRALDLQHMQVDPRNEDVYLADGFGKMFRLKDWNHPRFERCLLADGKKVSAVSLAIDPWNGYFYTHTHMSPVRRYALDGDVFKDSPVGDSKSIAVTPPICNDWRIGLGMGDRGLAIAPDGSLATLGVLQKGGAAYGGPLTFFRADSANAPWKPVPFPGFDKSSKSGGVRFDLRGNLYAGRRDSAPTNVPEGFKNYRDFQDSTGRIYKYAPTGKPGNLFPTAPEAPAKVYNVNYGSISPRFSRTPRFGVDGWGRIYYPTTLLPKVSVIDNEGNAVLSFGTWGNRDSTGGLAGDLAPTDGVPMAWPNSVDATDDYVYVSDLVNARLMRLAKTFAACETVEIK